MTPGLDFEIEKPLTGRECRRNLSREQLLRTSIFFKRIAEAVENEDLQHLKIGSFPLSECKLRISRIPPRCLYVLLSRLSGLTIREISISLGVTQFRVNQILMKGQRSLKKVKEICGDSVVDSFLDQHTTEILSTLEVQIELLRIERESLRNRPLRNPGRSFFYLIDGQDILQL